jgi:hypothetical protein
MKTSQKSDKLKKKKKKGGGGPKIGYIPMVSGEKFSFFFYQNQSNIFVKKN